MNQENTMHESENEPFCPTYTKINENLEGRISLYAFRNILYENEK